MALASAYGLNYEIPQQGGMQGQGYQQGSQNPIQGEDFGAGNLLSQELYVKEGMTDEYYKKVAALKSFANEVSSRYGFDVTRPDYRNPDSIRFHRSYLEALADLQVTQNNLKRLATQENIALQNPNIRQRTDAQGNDYFSNIGENSVVTAMRTAASQIKSREGLQGFEVARQDLIDQLSEELASAQSPRERDQITASIRQLEAIRPDVGISDAQQSELDIRERQLQSQEKYQNSMLGMRSRELDIQEKKAEQQALTGGLTKQQYVSGLGRFATIQDIATPEGLKTLGFDRVDRASGTYLERTVNGKKESVKIDPKDPSGTLFQINDLINKSGKGAPVTYDALAAFPDIDLDAIASDLISSLNPTEDKFSGFIQQFPDIAKKASSESVTREALATSLNSRGVKIPASVSSTFNNAIAEDMDVQKVEPVSSSFGFGSAGIKITLQKKNQKDKTSTKTLYFNDENDVQLMKEIFEYNSRSVNLPPALGGQGTIVAPTSSGGAAIDLDKM